MSVATHPRCGKTWGGLRAGHCPACCETFSSTSAGDRHRKGPQDARVCIPPAEAGLVLHDRPTGPVWCLPGPGVPDINDANPRSRTRVSPQTAEQSSRVVETTPR